MEYVALEIQRPNFPIFIKWTMDGELSIEYNDTVKQHRFIIENLPDALMHLNRILKL